jgi:hypothetical protein
LTAFVEYGKPKKYREDLGYCYNTFHLFQKDFPNERVSLYVKGLTALFESKIPVNLEKLWCHLLYIPGVRKFITVLGRHPAPADQVNLPQVQVAQDALGQRNEEVATMRGTLAEAIIGSKFILQVLRFQNDPRIEKAEEIFEELNDQLTAFVKHASSSAHPFCAEMVNAYQKFTLSIAVSGQINPAKDTKDFVDTCTKQLVEINKQVYEQLDQAKIGYLRSIVVGIAGALIGLCTLFVPYFFKGFRNTFLDYHHFHYCEDALNKLRSLVLLDTKPVDVVNEAKAEFQKEKQPAVPAPKP